MKYILCVAISLMLSFSLVFGQENSPKEVYLKYRKDIQSFNRIEDVYPFLSSGEVMKIKKADKKTVDFGLALMKMTAQGEVENIEEKVQGLEALITVITKDAARTSMTGKIKMTKEDGLWKIEKESWQETGAPGKWEEIPAGEVKNKVISSVEDTSKFGNQYALVDLMIDKESIEAPRLIVRIKNTDNMPIKRVHLFVFINGYLVTFSTIDTFKIDVNREYDVDLSGCLKQYYQNPENQTRPGNRLSVRIISEQNNTYLNKIIDIPVEIITALGVKKAYGQFKNIEPAKRRLPCKIVDIRAEKQAAGTYTYFLKIKNEANVLLKAAGDYSVIVNGKCGMLGFGNEFKPGEEKEMSITFGAGYRQKEDTKILQIFVVGHENDEFLEKTIVLK